LRVRRFNLRTIHLKKRFRKGALFLLDRFLIAEILVYTTSVSMEGNKIRNWKQSLQVMGREFGEFTVDIIYDRHQGGLFALFYSGFLHLLSLLFNVVVRLRLWLYRKRIFHNYHLGCAVIVVGNLTVGGTGKTPVVEKLARSLLGKGRKVAILSRGYKSRKEPLYKKLWRTFLDKEADPPKIVSDGTNVLLNSDVAGDEPYMLARNLPGVIVIVDKDRVKAGNYAIKRFGVDTLILDDGFQYFRMKDHFQLMMVDKNNPFGNGHLLPRGILREPLSHMRRASYVFLTKSDGHADPELVAQIRHYLPDTDMIECRHGPRYLQEVNGTVRLELDALKGKKLAAFSAIATPETFESFLSDLGGHLHYRKRFMDHHRFLDWELDQVFADAVESGAEMIVTTEKDAVRIESSITPPLPLYYLRVEIEFLSGLEKFENAISRFCFENREGLDLRNMKRVENGGRNE
jgi:tetraacyldisaccharide 4'-kinase